MSDLDGWLSWMELDVSIGYSQTPELTRNWFVLKNNVLYYYETEQASETVVKDVDDMLNGLQNTAQAEAAPAEPLGSIVLDDCGVEIIAEAKYNTKYCFELNSPMQPGGNCTFVLAADSGARMQEWMNAVRRAMLRLRRLKAKQKTADRQRTRQAIDGRTTQSEAGSLANQYTTDSSGDSEESKAAHSGVYRQWLEETNEPRATDGMGRSLMDENRQARDPIDKCLAQCGACSIQ